MKSFLLFCLGLLAWPAQADLRVLACEPEWATLAAEIGGDRVKAVSATTALQDPHHIEARPSLIARARNADLLVCTGAELEVGWLPILQRESGNPRIQPGQSGYLEAASVVPLLEKPTRLDRSEGDIHAAGNPHIQTDPRNIPRVAEALTKRMVELDPANANHYAGRHADFSQRWQTAMARWERQAAPLRGIEVVSQHKGFPYLYAWLGMREVAVLEPKPGLEPSVSYLSEVMRKLHTQHPRMILRAAYQSSRPSEWLSARTGLPVVVLPYTVGGSNRTRDLFSLFDDTLDRLLGGLK
jgi:zinc/manganese transport system substrate-binding protein